jgi:hypothetical protein
MTDLNIPTTGREGTWTAEDFRQLFTLDPALVDNRGGIESPISYDAAVATLIERLTASLDKPGFATNIKIGSTERRQAYQPQQIAAGLAQTIVHALGPDAMYQNVIDSMDLRPYLQVIADNPQMRVKEELAFNQDARHDIDPVALSALRASYEESERQRVADALTRNGLDASKSAVDQFFADTPGAGTVGKSPAARADPNAANAAIAMSNGAVDVNPASPEFDPKTVAGERAKVKPFSRGDLQLLLNTQSLGWDDLIDANSNLDETGRYVPINMGMKPITPADVAARGGEVRQWNPAAQVADQVSIIDAAKWPTTLAPAEVIQLQRNLRNAGLLPAGYIEGDALDATFQQAWRNVLVESARRNIPVTKVYSQEFQRTQTRSLEQADVMTAANAMAAKTIGRPLTYGEFGRVMQTLQTLNSDLTHNVQWGSEGQGSNVVRGVDSNDMAAAVNDATVADASRNRMMGAFQAIARASGSEYYVMTEQKRRQDAVDEGEVV